jgi:hypothetical protein
MLVLVDIFGSLDGAGVHLSGRRPNVFEN